MPIRLTPKGPPPPPPLVAGAASIPPRPVVLGVKRITMEGTMGSASRVEKVILWTVVVCAIGWLFWRIAHPA
jgi:hypothetical protein